MRSSEIYALVLMVLTSIPTRVYSQTPESIDLGLSVEWGATNLGATAPEDFGGYYGWADPTGLETTMDVLDNGNKLFLPAGGARNGETVRYAGTVGYYWTGTLGADPSMHKQRAHRLYIGAEGLNHNPAIRYSGFSIRPVRDRIQSGISEITTNDQLDDSPIYDLTGRPLNSKPEKGFYIQNGKKYLVR